jgi:hypothetical protein
VRTKVCTLVVLATIAFSVPAFSIHNEPTDFRGIQFGSPPTSIFKCVFESGADAVYEKPKDDLNVFGVHARSIKYIFIDKKFTYALVRYGIVPSSTMEGVMTRMNERFGPSTKVDREYGVTTTYWIGGKTSIMFKSKFIDGDFEYEITILDNNLYVQFVNKSQKNDGL